MNYTSLLANIQSWFEDDSTEFVAAIPQIITNAEHRIFREIPDFLDYKVTFSASLVQGTNTITKQTSQRTTRAVSITVGSDEVFLEQRSETYLHDYWPNALTESQPIMWAEVNATTIIIAPTPDLAYTYKTYYRIEPTGLTGSNANTYLGDNYEDFLMAAALQGAAEFLIDEQEMALWEGKYQTLKPGVQLEVQRNYASEYGAR